MSDFNPQTYWSEWLDRSFSIGGVGWLGLGESFNRWAYRVRRRIFLRTARGVVADMPTARVLDVGTGTGFYIDRWHELGAGEVAGADLTEVAVQRLREARLAAGLTAHALAARAGVATATVLRIEREDGRPLPRTARRLADALGLPPSEIAEFRPVVEAIALPRPTVEAG